MKKESVLNPTIDQTLEIEALGPYDFRTMRDYALSLQRKGEVERACNERFRAVQKLEELLEDEDEPMLSWDHANTRAALEVVYGSAVDHFLIDDCEMAAALLEWLSELDPEDHLESVSLLALLYVALEDYESFDAVVNDLSEGPDRTVTLLWCGFRRTGTLDAGELRHFRERYGAYHAEFLAADHPADESYLADIESASPSTAAQARELWLRTEPLWNRFPDFIAALQKA